MERDTPLLPNPSHSNAHRSRSNLALSKLKRTARKREDQLDVQRIDFEQAKRVVAKHGTDWKPVHFVKES